MSSYDQYNTRNEYPPQQYSDHNDGAFNPYEHTQPHQTYEQGGYQDGEYRDEPMVPAVPSKEKESAFVSARAMPPKYVACIVSVTYG